MNPPNNNVPSQPESTISENKRTKPQLDRIPFGYKEAMNFISRKLEGYSESTSGSVSKAEKPEGPIEFRWKSSFKPLDKAEEGEGPSEEKHTSSPKKDELYNPYEPASSDSENEMPQGQDHTDSETVQDLGSQSLSPERGSSEKSRWDSCVLRPGSHPLSRLDFGSVTIPSLSPVHIPPDQLAYSPDTESVDPAGYESINRPLDHRVCSPDRLIPASSTQLFPAYGAQSTNGEERITIPECRREVSPVRQMTTVRLSPPRLKQDYQQQLGYVETELDQIPPPNKVPRLESKRTIMDKNPIIICDLCEVELANGQELEDHLESKSHWDTLEHIQQHNNYDDIVIAFLQDVMLFKSRQCSRAIEDCALQALQENDHMTKIELFHCAACKVFISTSASSVQAHITSQEHLSNTQEFEARQSHTCLNKAETMMKELKPQFEHFLQPFRLHSDWLEPIQADMRGDGVAAHLSDRHPTLQSTVYVETLLCFR